MQTTRRDLLGLGLAAGSAASVFWLREAAAQSAASLYAGAFPKLDRFVEQYMRDMNSPGMTLVLADKEGVQRIVTYGFSDLENKRRVAETDLFQIGSISKSFLVMVLLQLHQEGKLDFDKPVSDYLPWLRISSRYAPITAHHLLTHSSGLAANGDLFPSDPAEKHLAFYEPGTQFYYNNMGYQLLGLLAWTLDGRELPEQLRARIFRPLGMTASEPVIDFDTLQRAAKSYAPWAPDRPYTRHGRLSEAPAIVTSNAAGSILSTPRDMGSYLHMLIDNGAGLITPASFERMTQRHVAADEFGAGVGYGYGMAIDEIDGHKLIRHTGGMVSFMSSLMIDSDEGVGGFASINAQQGYRPNPVVRYALQLMRAQRANKPLPPVPAADPEDRIENAGDYVGVFKGAKGTLEFMREGTQLFLARQGKRLALESLGDDDHFHVRDAGFDRFALVFGRNDNKAVVDVSWGEDWYTNAAYVGPTKFDVPAAWHSYVGYYRNGDPWTGSVRIVIRKGQLWMDGVTPLEAEGDLFRVRGEPTSTDWVRFGPVVNGKCMQLKWTGVDCWRFAVP